MKRSILALAVVLSITQLNAQSFDLSGYKVVQANASTTITLPAGTTIQPGSYVIIARNATRAAFETFWNTVLPAHVTFINGTAVIGGNGFPSLNGAETYTLQNASSVAQDGPTVAIAVGESIQRTSISGSAGVEGSWSRVPQASATPGSGVVNTNSGKLIISEFSDASAFANEFVEIYYDVTPPASGQGIGSISPARWKFNAGTDLQIKVKPEADTIRGIRVVKPSLFNWNSANISVQPNTGTLLHSGDTTTLSNIALQGTDSIIISIGSVTTTDTTDNLFIEVYTSMNGASYLPIQSAAKTLVYGNPRPMNLVKAKDGGGNHIFLGKWVVAKGVVTVGGQFGGPSYLQDATGAIAAFDSSVSNNVTIGDEVVLLGIVAPFNNLFEFAPAVLLENISSGNAFDTTVLTIPQIKAQSTAEPYESKLVRINGIQKVLTTANAPATAWTASGSGTNYKLASGSDTLEVRISGRINLANLAIPTSTFDIVGVLGQFQNSYQLLPRFISDVVTVGGGPIILTAPPYETDITTNSITVSWSTNTPGSSIVKYGTTTAYGSEQIDATPVTDHTVTIDGLQPATVYHLQIGTADANGTTTASDHVAITSSAGSGGAINAYFSKSIHNSVASAETAKTTTLSQVLINRINAAQFSIDFCTYSLSGTVGANVAEALLNAKNRGVAVRVIGEKDNQGTAPWTTLKNGGITVIDDTYDALNAGAGLMHNKFFVFDARNNSFASDDWVIMGSWNATDPGTNDDAQNILEIQDEALARAYTMEFEEMWGSSAETPNASASRFGARKLNNTPHRFKVGVVPIDLYFSPSDNVTAKINDALKSSVSSINVAMLSLTRDELGQTLVAKKNAGKKVRVLMSNNTDSGNEFSYLQTNGVDVRLKGGALTGLLHHKYAIIDAENPSATDQTVVTGSHNWSSSAESSNNENTLIVHSKRIANLFLQEFKARYLEAGGTDSILVSVERENESAPSQFALHQNYPNPFNPTTNITFSIAERSFTRLAVYDVLGREMTILVHEQLNPGNYSLQLNASALASGVYFYRLEAGNFVQTKKLLLQK